MKLATVHDRAVLVLGEEIADVAEASGGRFGPDPMAVYDDWDAFTIVPVDDRCLARATDVGTEFGLRTVDAVHLAAADRLPRPTSYLTFDRHQIPGALALGLQVISPLASES